MPFKVYFKRAGQGLAIARTDRPVCLFVEKKTRIELGEIATIGPFTGRVTAIGVEGKCLAVHLRELEAEFC
jgi:hypothetical protein